MKAILVGVIVLLSLSVKAQDMQKYLSDTKAMIKDKNYKEALERCIWFHEHALEYNQGMTGVRLSFALSDWKSLGEVYPPARDSLIAIRDRKTAILITNGTPTNLFSDVSSINRVLNENDKTIQLFDTLSIHHPEGMKIFWIYAKNILFAAKRYDIIRKYVGNPVREFSLAVTQFNLNKSLYKNQKINSANFKAYNENSFVERSLELISFSLAVKDPKSAKEIQQKALKIVEDYRLHDAIAKK